ncbi:Protein kinase domain [Dillenia turbinata]|uniref:non-specific serine/threonine protein kinase n=1 Tax=Dillenia turbinata TaxID=194707 RepID=A0AAN8VQW9_9MAGN
MDKPTTAPPSSSKARSVLPYQTPRLRDHYTLGRKLGQGQFGTTYLCVEKSTSNQFACKSIPKRRLLTREDYEDVWREIQIMHHLSEHPTVVRIKGTYEDVVFVHLVMELCSGGDLFDQIVKRGHYSEKQAVKLIKTVVEVVEACHSLGVVHRDLKPENFLFSSPDEDSSLKATDFGLSVFYKPGEALHDVVGSPYYVAPEVLMKHYGPEIDVWSAGIILYILLSGVPPFWAGHPWIMDDTVAPDKPLDSAVLTRLKQFSAMNKLKKMALRVIAERLSEEEIGGLKQLFKMIDTDNSGTITFEELKDGLKRVGSKLMESEIRTLMDAADIDSSGSIDYGEFLAATLHMNKLDREENLVAAFSFFDKDNSGYITIDELQQACRDFGLCNAHLDEIIKEIDQDNDGRIDYSEFAAMMRRGDGGAGSKTMRGGLNFNLGDALEVGKQS